MPWDKSFRCFDQSAEDLVDVMFFCRKRLELIFPGHEVESDTPGVSNPQVLRDRSGCLERLALKANCSKVCVFKCFYLVHFLRLGVAGWLIHHTRWEDLPAPMQCGWLVEECEGEPCTIFKHQSLIVQKQEGQSAYHIIYCNISLVANMLVKLL